MSSLLSATEPPHPRPHPPSRTPSKVQHVSLPPEFSLSLFLRNIQHAVPSWNTHNPACSWEGVRCDDTGQVSFLEWAGYSLRGAPAWGSLPPTVRALDLAMRVVGDQFRFNQLGGEIDTGALPPQLRWLVLGDNQFEGTLSLEALPRSVVWVDVSANKLCGSLRFALLPPQLRSLQLNLNPELGGVLYLSDLPPTVTSINIEGTRIVGVEAG